MSHRQNGFATQRSPDSNAVCSEGDIEVGKHAVRFVLCVASVARKRAKWMRGRGCNCHVAGGGWLIVIGFLSILSTYFRPIRRSI